MRKRDIYGYAGKMLHLDLHTGEFSTEPTEKYAREWIGGSGIAQWILYNHLKPWVTPYAPANEIIFSAGPLVGTLAPGASRMSADSQNTQTFGVGTSNSDSFFSSQLKYAGYDHILIHGRSRKPVYLWIDDDRTELRDASHLWGMTTWETVDAIRQELGDTEEIHTVSIGPGGENLVREACIMQDKGRTMGRCGIGGVMGSKNLKAIAVRGTGSVEVAEPERFMEMVFRLREIFEKSAVSKIYRDYGVPMALKSKQASCGIPYKNFQELVLPDELYKKINYEQFVEKYQAKVVGYPACPQHCSRIFHIHDGPYAGLVTEGFWFEQLAEFTGRLAVWEPTFVPKLNSYCNQLGVGVDLVAGAIGWAMECYQRGILTRSDTDGLELEWGDTEVILELTRKIAYREGFGNILAEGCSKASQIIGRGSEYYAMHMKGQDLYEVIRSAIAWGLGSCISTRGGGHVHGSPLFESVITPLDEAKALKVFGARVTNDPISFEGKAAVVHYFERFHRLCNALGICQFCTVWADINLPGFPELAELYSAATGWQTTEPDLKRITSKMLNVEKAFNLIHTDLDRKDDYPPDRDLTEPIPSGTLAGFHLTREKWDGLLDEYYEMNDWDKKTSYPTKRCLTELGLGQIVKDLSKCGKLVDA